MPSTYTHNPLHIRLLIVLGALFFLLLLAAVAPHFVNTGSYRQQIIQAIKLKTGKEAVIKGEMKLALLPLPTFYVSGLELRDGAADNSPSITIDQLSIRVSPLTVFSSQPTITRITLEQPVLEIHRAQDNLIHWDWIDSALLKSLIGGNNGSPVTIGVINGQILYHDSRTAKDVTFDNIDVEGATGPNPKLEGDFTLYGHDLHFGFSTGGNADGGAMPFDLAMTGDGTSKLRLQGTLDTMTEKPAVNGKLSLDVDNMLNWVAAKTQNAPPPAQGNASVPPQAMPVKITGDWAEEGMDITLSGIALQGVNSTGSGNIALSWLDWRPNVVANLDFSALNYEQWKQVLIKALSTSTTVLREDYQPAVVQTAELPQGVHMLLNLTAKEVHFGQQIWHDGQIKAEFAENVLTVNQFHIVLPGDTQMTLFGIVSQSDSQDMRFEGTMETSGKSLRELLTIFDESAVSMPEDTFGQFFIRSNLFVSSQQLRLSEADAKINDLNLNGGLVAYFDATPRVEADVKLKDINFDYFRDVWREKHKAGDNDFFLKFDPNMNFDWLKKLQATVDFRVNVDRFTFLERQGDSASFRLFAKQGEFGIYNMRFNYPNEVAEAGFTLNVTGSQPLVSLVLNTDNLNTDYFLADSGSHAPSQNPAPAANPNGDDDNNAGEEKPLDVPEPPPVPGGRVMLLPAQPSASAPATVDPEKKAQPAKTPSPQSSLFISNAYGDDTALPPDADTDTTSDKPNSKWSDALFDMSWMDGWNGTFDISIGKLVHNGITVDHLKFQGKLDDNLLLLQNMTFYYWQGRCAVSGSLYGGKVPGVAIGFTLFSVDMQDMLKELTGRENISGKMSISGTLSTSGVNEISWVQQADTKMVITGRGVDVSGLNMQGVLDAVAVSRTASDVFNNVNRALVNGTSEFSVDGNVNVKDGIMRTPGVTIKTGNITGDLTGDVKLLPWNMDISTLFQFPGITSETVPTMTVQLVGPIENPQLRTDTSSLEAYVTKRIVGK